MHIFSVPVGLVLIFVGNSMVKVGPQSVLLTTPCWMFSPAARSGAAPLRYYLRGHNWALYQGYARGSIRVLGQLQPRLRATLRHLVLVRPHRHLREQLDLVALHGGQRRGVALAVELGHDLGVDLSQERLVKDVEDLARLPGVPVHHAR